MAKKKKDIKTINLVHTWYTLIFHSRCALVTMMAKYKSSNKIQSLSFLCFRLSIFCFVLNVTTLSLSNKPPLYSILLLPNPWFSMHHKFPSVISDVHSSAWVGSIHLEQIYINKIRKLLTGSKHPL